MIHPDTLELLPSTANWLNSLEIFGHIGRVNILPEQMAWVVFVLKALPDGDGRFPHGKWATIQHIESWVTMMAKQTVKDLGKIGAEL